MSTIVCVFNQDEYYDLIYAAREATIRFKRARTEFRKGNEAYSQWDEETLEERITHYTSLEDRLNKIWSDGADSEL